MARRSFIFVFIVVIAGTLFAMGQTTTAASKVAVSSTGYVPVKEYDPKRDANRDVANAVAEAKRTNKNVLVEIGGQWCVWCRYFDKFFADNSTHAQFRDENYIMVKVNFSPENKNEALISKYGKVPGYPHLFVLDKDGKLLHSQDTSKLEEGRGYNMTAVANFLKEWSPRSTNAAK
jgi:thiol:disulfide interchange protein